MKKFNTFVTFLLCLLCFVSCGKTKIPEEGGELSIDEYEVTVSFANWSNDESIIGGALNKDKINNSDKTHYPIFKMETKENLERFKYYYSDVLSMNETYDEVESFENVTSKYDEAFFETNTLLIVYVDANSGSLRFGVSGVYCDSKSVCVYVENLNNPTIFTDDMVGWFITVAISNSTIYGCQYFDAY
ncbi:MAG: hypothetical protein IJ437_04335 [Clostridia bacterium]|nr:hypothetical protein [Clostridia bacterium]